MLPSFQFNLAMRLATAILFILSFTASTKQGPQGVPPSPTIVGYWVGKYSDDSTSYPTNLYAFLFRSNGTVRVYDPTVDTSLNNAAEGTYTVTGNIVTTTYTYLSGLGPFSSTATVDSDDIFMEGSWDVASTPRGLFFIAK